MWRQPGRCLGFACAGPSGAFGAAALLNLADVQATNGMISVFPIRGGISFFRFCDQAIG
jgi:hypothetical protein